MPVAGGDDRKLASLGFFSFSAAILFVAIPAFMLSGNVNEISSPGTKFLAFIAMGAAFVAAGFVVTRFMQKGRATGALIAAYASSLYVSDALFPLGIGPIETGKEIGPWQPLGAAVQASLFAGIALFFFVRPSL